MGSGLTDEPTLLSRLSVNPLGYPLIVAYRRVLAYLPRGEPWPLETIRAWMASQAEHWSEHGFGWFALEHRPGGQLIGWCGLCLLCELTRWRFFMSLKILVVRFPT